MRSYYNLAEDLKNYPDACVYFIIGGRSTGKTYSTLLYTQENHVPFVFMKRTNKDVDMLCAGSGSIGTKKASYGFDASPFVSINRDKGTNIKAYKIDDGMGGFWKCDDDNSPVGDPIGTIVSLHKVSKVKGMDFSSAQMIIFDEFIPMSYERVDRKEGEQLTDFFQTVQRSNFKLKLVCLANATDVSCPILQHFELVDKIAEMDITGQSILYMPERKILVHKLTDNEEFMEEEKKNPIYAVMAGTQWAEMSLENKFAYNDFSNIGHKNLKNHVPVVGIIYKAHHWFVYQRDGSYYMCDRKNNKCPIYNLNRENDQKRFYFDHVIDLRERCIDDRFTFQTYPMYDLIVNYKEFFKL